MNQIKYMQKCREMEREEKWVKIDIEKVLKQSLTYAVIVNVANN